MACWKRREKQLMAIVYGSFGETEAAHGCFREGFWRMMEKECVEVKESRCER